VPDLSAILPDLPNAALKAYTGPWNIEIHGIDAKAHLEFRGDFIVIAIPGTDIEDPGDLWADAISMWAHFDDHLGFFVPAGFGRNGRALYEAVRGYIDRPVILVGHSLGGATASQVAGHMLRAGHDVAWLETYGEPCGIPKDLADLIEHVPGVRVVRNGDPIVGMLHTRWGHRRGPPMTIGGAPPMHGWGVLPIGRHSMAGYRADMPDPRP
jgi:hypothetical protein